MEAENTELLPPRLGMVSRPSNELPGTRRLTRGPNVLSFDCGTSNFCYCLVEDTSGVEIPRLRKKAERLGQKFVPPERDDIFFHIHCWENFNLNSSDFGEAVACMVKKLDQKRWMLSADHVVVEGQVPFNTKMKSISHCVQTYFACRANPLPCEGEDFARPMKYDKLAASFISAACKFHNLPGYVSEDGLAIADAKKKAIRICAEILREQKGSHSPDFEFMFNHYKKQDDLADSFLQGLYYLKVLQTRKRQNKVLTEMLSGVVIDLDSPFYRLTGKKRTYDADNLNWSKRADEEFQAHLVFKSPHFRRVEFDASSCVLEKPKTIPKQIWKDL